MHCPNCRAALPANSRFCNACGAAIGGGGAQPTRPMPPTGAPGSQGAAHPRPGEATRYPGVPAPAYYAAAPAPAEQNRKPVWLLAAAVALLLLCVVLGSVAVARGFKNPLTANPTRPAAPSPGVQVASNPQAPALPGVVQSRSPRPPAPGPAAVAGSGPKEPEMAPPLTMSPNRQPSAPSVVSTPSSPTAPAGPSPILTPSRPAPPSPGVTQQQPRPAPGPAAPPPPPDNSDFDRYLQWLRFVENERGGLRARGETQSFRIIQSFYAAMFGLADPDANDVQLQQQFNRNLQAQLNQVVADMRLFRANITNSRRTLRVPADCKALDAYYMAAVDQESQMTAQLLDAMMRQDIGRVKQIGQAGVGSIDQNLGMANKALEKVYQGRGLNQQFVIKTGGGSSMLGGMVGLGGVGL